MKDFQFDKSKICKILVIKPRAIGDVLLSTPVLPNLREEFPHAQIDFLVEKFASPVLNENPFIDNVISYDSKNQSSLSIIMQVRKSRYNLVIDVFANPRTAIITKLSGAKYRVGFPFKWRRYAYNILVTPRSGDVHNVEFNLDALRRLGLQPKYKNPTFYLDVAATEFAHNFLNSKEIAAKAFIAINVGGGWKTKRWDLDKFSKLCEMISSQLHFPVVALYGPDEKKDAEKIVESSQGGVILAPLTSLHEMGAIMKASKLLITNDSGPMHIAAALGVPTLAIFGPTNPRLQGPYGNLSEIVRNERLDCLECNLTKCPIGNPCMHELRPEIVFERLLKLISRIEQGTPISSATKGVTNIDENI